MKSLDYLQKDGRLAGLEYKFSYSEKPPFKRLKVKLKKEIVTLGVSDIDPTHFLLVLMLSQLIGMSLLMILTLF